jgi:uncharacterized protein YqgC (DUF456 family)
MDTLGTLGIFSLVGLICFAGFILSCLSLSGTWLVLLATGLASWQQWPEFPNIGTLVLFLVVCIAVEVADSFAGLWGVDKFNGTKATGWAAVGGGFLGMFLGGAFIPIPIIGSLVGMLAGCFGCAFLVEYSKIKKVNHATQVATGAVLARIGVLILKTGATLAMIFYLAIGLAI